MFAGRDNVIPKVDPSPILHPIQVRKFPAKDLPDQPGIKGNESRRVYCRFCGFPCDTERDSLVDDRNDLNGNTAAVKSYVLHGKTFSYAEVTSRSGCPLCGSRNYL